MVHLYAKECGESYGGRYQFHLAFRLIHPTATMVVRLAIVPSRRRCSGNRSLELYKIPRTPTIPSRDFKGMKKKGVSVKVWVPAPETSPLFRVQVAAVFSFSVISKSTLLFAQTLRPPSYSRKKIMAGVSKIFWTYFNASCPSWLKTLDRTDSVMVSGEELSSIGVRRRKSLLISSMRETRFSLSFSKAYWRRTML